MRALPFKSVAPVRASAAPASIAGEPGRRRKSPSDASVNNGSPLTLEPLPTTGPVLELNSEWSIVSCPGTHGAGVHVEGSGATIETRSGPFACTTVLRASITPAGADENAAS